MKNKSYKTTGKVEADILDKYINRIINHDKGALAELYHRTSGSVYGFALSVLKNMEDAEDVLQDTYLKIYSSASTYKSQGKPLAWILTIARNLSYMKLRDRKKTVDIPDHAWEDAFDKIPSVTPEDRLLLTACMDKLSDEESQIIMLHAVSGFKHREIGEVLSLPLATVLSKYHRALKKLRVLLTEGK